MIVPYFYNTSKEPFVFLRPRGFEVNVNKSDQTAFLETLPVTEIDTRVYWKLKLILEVAYPPKLWKQHTVCKMQWYKIKIDESPDQTNLLCFLLE